jgi:hypothetical protein
MFKGDNKKTQSDWDCEGDWSLFLIPAADADLTLVN